MTRPNRRYVPLIALALLALGFVALVALSSVALRGARLDLTQKQLYTLSEGTRNVLGRVDEPIRLKLYYSEHATRDLQQFRVFATRVRELLEEIAARSENGSGSMTSSTTGRFSGRRAGRGCRGRSRRPRHRCRASRPRRATGRAGRAATRNHCRRPGAGSSSDRRPPCEPPCRDSALRS